MHHYQIKRKKSDSPTTKQLCQHCLVDGNLTIFFQEQVLHKGVLSWQKISTVSNACQKLLYILSLGAFIM